jgi:hypothetical protein
VAIAELFYNPEDGGDTFLRNVGYHSTHYTASYPRRRYSSRHHVVYNIVTNVSEERLYLSSPLMMEAVDSSENLVTIYHIIK